MVARTEREATAAAPTAIPAIWPPAKADVVSGSVCVKAVEEGGVFEIVIDESEAFEIVHEEAGRFEVVPDGSGPGPPEVAAENGAAFELGANEAGCSVGFGAAAEGAARRGLRIAAAGDCTACLKSVGTNTTECSFQHASVGPQHHLDWLGSPPQGVIAIFPPLLC